MEKCFSDYFIDMTLDITVSAISCHFSESGSLYSRMTVAPPEREIRALGAVYASGAHAGWYIIRTRALSAFAEPDAEISIARI